jgi:hypothetical protein
LPETRVWGSAPFEEGFCQDERELSQRSQLGNLSGSPEIVSDSLLAAEGGVNPKTIRFTQDSISASFKKEGTTLADTIEGLKAGKIDPNSIPPIRTFEQNGKVFTLDNRRLYVFQEAGIPIRTTPATAEEVAAEAWKFTTKNEGTSIRVRGQ